MEIGNKKIVETKKDCRQSTVFGDSPNKCYLTAPE